MGTFGTPTGSGDSRDADPAEPPREALDGFFWERRRRSAALPLAAGLIGLAALGTLQQWPVRNGVEQDLAARSRLALDGAGLPSVQVSFDGRDAVLTGQVRTDAERARAIEVVEGLRGVRVATEQLAGPPTTAPTGSPAVTPSGSSSGSPSGTSTGSPPAATPPTSPPTGSSGATAPVGPTAPGTSTGPTAPGTSTAASGSSGPPSATGAPVPTRLSARISAGTVTLGGLVPSAQARTTLVTAVEAALPGTTVQDRLTIDPSAGRAGLEHLPEVLQALGPDSSVTVELGGGALVLAGEVPAESNRTAAVAAAAVVVGDPAAVSDQLTVDPEAIVRALLSGQPPVTFRTAYSTLDPAEQRTVAEIAQILKDHPTVHVRVLGFTDDVGAADMNYGLSYARARTVYLLLQRRGVPRSQLTFQAFGEKRPAVPNTSAANRAANRRVEFEVRR